MRISCKKYVDQMPHSVDPSLNWSNLCIKKKKERKKEPIKYFENDSSHFKEKQMWKIYC